MKRLDRFQEMEGGGKNERRKKMLERIAEKYK
jgi:hypothetical protein